MAKHVEEVSSLLLRDSALSFHGISSPILSQMVLLQGMDWALNVKGKHLRVYACTPGMPFFSPTDLSVEHPGSWQSLI